MAIVVYGPSIALQAGKASTGLGKVFTVNTIAMTTKLSRYIYI